MRGREKKGKIKSLRNCSDMRAELRSAAASRVSFFFSPSTSCSVTVDISRFKRDGGASVGGGKQLPLRCEKFLNNSCASHCDSSAQTGSSTAHPLPSYFFSKQIKGRKKYRMCFFLFYFKQAYISLISVVCLLERPLHVHKVREPPHNLTHHLSKKINK